MTNWTNPDYQDEIFNRYAKDPSAWLRSAKYLRLAADELCWVDADYKPIDEEDKPWKQFTINIYLMILGLSFELLIKGLLIAQGEEILEGGVVKQKFLTHKMEPLLSKLDTKSFSLTTDERSLLKHLEEYVWWQGRYPIPKKADKLDYSL